ncbi:MAG: CRISPR-associated helicase Cas3', partial [Gorillibacterium sp.]|nr:CRISPR-associated helicase Cas3' [Gorillibacterium sp.]
VGGTILINGWEGQMLYYAHRTDSDDKQEWQLLIDHLRNVRTKAGQFADAFAAKDWGELVGWNHDIGKYSVAFQKRLAGSRIAVDHATAGAKSINEKWLHSLSKIPAYVIAGHHTGLPDYGTPSGDDSCLARRLIKTVEPYHAAFSELEDLPLPTRPPIKPGVHPGLQFSLLTRMLFSCVVDADSLDAEKYDSKSRASLRGHDVSFSLLFDQFNEYMNLHFPKPRSPIEAYRSELLKECLAKADGSRGLHMLTLPTGSGKTLISLGYALKHAAAHGLSRIIFVIPYTSIIEQNAAKFREVVGSQHVLEHHSNVQREQPEAEDYPFLRKKLELAEENWDYPIVVTTNVQFFESLYANKRSRCRKLHNIANSVIVFDEAQMMNGDFYKPSLYALEELTRNYGSTALLCTATQPNISMLFSKPITVKELIDQVPLRFKQFERVKLEKLGVLGLGELSERIQAHEQVLCVVNTRRMAREIYEACRVRSGEDEVFHLSARMCPKHRQKILKAIRVRLDDKLPCRLISTQLIECGVDVDFPVVYRELAGLDSIAQAAGRCNRNGKQAVGITYVFETESGPPKGWFTTTANVTKTIMTRFAEDPLSLTAVNTYFEELYMYQTAGEADRTDRKNILGMLAERAKEMEFPFRTVAEEFQLIDTAAQPVIIPYDEVAEEKLESLLHAPTIGGLLRELQPYIVQLYPEEFEAFRKAGEIVEVRDGVWKLRNFKYWYKEDIGIEPYSIEYHAAEILVF